MENIQEDDSYDEEIISVSNKGKKVSGSKIKYNEKYYQEDINNEKTN
ncbi:MAG: hypothetical protein HFH68_04805 [Lachnospiraceae bacterium]|nr:hypothetical protein [Lachnospiraceae bacterium]